MPSKKPKNHFDAKAAECDDSSEPLKMNRAIAAAIRGFVPLSKAMSVLDFGCGTGLIRRELFQCLEIFFHCLEKNGSPFSTVWKEWVLFFQGLEFGQWRYLLHSSS